MELKVKSRGKWYLAECISKDQKHHLKLCWEDEDGKENEETVHKFSMTHLRPVMHKSVCF